MIKFQFFVYVIQNYKTKQTKKNVTQNDKHTFLEFSAEISANFLEIIFKMCWSEDGFFEVTKMSLSDKIMFSQSDGTLYENKCIWSKSPSKT